MPLIMAYPYNKSEKNNPRWRLGEAADAQGSRRSSRSGILRKAKSPWFTSFHSNFPQNSDIKLRNRIKKSVGKNFYRTSDFDGSQNLKIGQNVQDSWQHCHTGRATKRLTGLKQLKYLTESQRLARPACCPAWMLCSLCWLWLTGWAAGPCWRASRYITLHSTCHCAGTRFPGMWSAFSVACNNSKSPTLSSQWIVSDRSILTTTHQETHISTLYLLMRVQERDERSRDCGESIPSGFFFPSFSSIYIEKPRHTLTLFN